MQGARGGEGGVGPPLAWPLSAGAGRERGALVQFEATKTAFECLAAQKPNLLDLLDLEERSEEKRTHKEDFLGLIADRLRVEAPYAAVSFLNAVMALWDVTQTRENREFERVTADMDKQLQRTCTTCGKNPAQAGVTNLKKCSSCKGVVRYCSRHCQQADWPQHKLVCRSLPHLAGT